MSTTKLSAIVQLRLTRSQVKRIAEVIAASRKIIAHEGSALIGIAGYLIYRDKKTGETKADIRLRAVSVKTAERIGKILKAG